MVRVAEKLLIEFIQKVVSKSHCYFTKKNAEFFRFFEVMFAEKTQFWRLHRVFVEGERSVEAERQSMLRLKRKDFERVVDLW